MKIHGLIIWIILGLISFQSCKKTDLKAIKVRDFNITGIKNGYYSILRNIKYNNNEAIAYIDKDSGYIKIFDLKGLLIKKYEIKNNEVLKLIYVDNILNSIYEDSLYCLLNSNNLLLITNKGEQTIQLTNQLENKNVQYNTLNIKTSPFLEIKKGIYLTLITRQINQSSPEGRAEFFKYKPLAIIKKQINNYIIKDLPIKYPWFVYKDSGYYNDQQLDYVLAGSFVYYMMERSPFIYRYSLLNGKTDSMKVNSEFINEREIKPFDDLDFTSTNFYEKIIEYNYKIPKYQGLFYAKGSSYIMRINSIATPYKEKGKKVNYRNYSISFIDTNMNYVGEIPFLKDSIYNFFNFLPTSKGFIVAYKQTKEDIRLNRMRLCEYEVSF